ncbi:MAG: pyrroline-5-carboxylate reductase [Clostridia bacterium]|nr:pyrroline-5-carboxylate reductase [Clostridia bacterium]
MKYTLGFIGCGNMGGALITAATRAISAKNIVICDHNKAKTNVYAQQYGLTVADAETVAKEAKFVIFGVKPQVMKQAIEPLSDILKHRENVVVVTMAAGLSMDSIQTFIGAKLPVIRIMPNTPVAVGKGMVLYSTDGMDAQTETEFLRCFAQAGVFDKLPENKMDGGSALSGCGPAFVYAFAEALADGGVECGVPRDKAALYAAQTLLGAAEMLLQYGHPADLKDAVCSPGGTTIAGIHALEKAGFRGATMEAVLAAYQRTLELK